MQRAETTNGLSWISDVSYQFHQYDDRDYSVGRALLLTRRSVSSQVRRELDLRAYDSNSAHKHVDDLISAYHAKWYGGSRTDQDIRTSDERSNTLVNSLPDIAKVVCSNEDVHKLCIINVSTVVSGSFDGSRNPLLKVGRGLRIHRS